MKKNDIPWYIYTAVYICMAVYLFEVLKIYG